MPQTQLTVCKHMAVDRLKVNIKGNVDTVENKINFPINQNLKEPHRNSKEQKAHFILVSSEV